MATASNSKGRRKGKTISKNEANKPVKHHILYLNITDDETGETTSIKRYFKTASDKAELMKAIKGGNGT